MFIASQTHTHNYTWMIGEEQNEIERREMKGKKSINDFDIEGNSRKQACNQLFNCIFYPSGPICVCALVLAASIIYVQID